MKRSFKLGTVTITGNAQLSLRPSDIRKALLRHSRCDWGCATPESKELNDYVLRMGGRYPIFSVYRGAKRVLFWVITEADLSATKILMPGEDLPPATIRAF